MENCFESYHKQIDERRITTFIVQKMRQVVWLSGHYGGNFCRVANGVLDPFGSDAFSQLSVVGSVFAAVGNSASAVTISGKFHILVETNAGCLGSNYKERLIGYPKFDLRLLK